jgi:hypothetical protein
MPSLTAHRGERTIGQPHLRQTGVQQTDSRQSDVLPADVHPTDVHPTDVHPTNVRLTNASFIPVRFTETLIVVVEGSDSGFPDQPVYHIQWWRVMVLEPVVDPNSRIPAKQT